MARPVGLGRRGASSLLREPASSLLAFPWASVPLCSPRVPQLGCTFQSRPHPSRLAGSGSHTPCLLLSVQSRAPAHEQCCR